MKHLAREFSRKLERFGVRWKQFCLADGEAIRQEGDWQALRAYLINIRRIGKS